MVVKKTDWLLYETIKCHSYQWSLVPRKVLLPGCLAGLATASQCPCSRGRGHNSLWLTRWSVAFFLVPGRCPRDRKHQTIHLEYEFIFLFNLSTWCKRILGILILFKLILDDNISQFSLQFICSIIYRKSFFCKLYFLFKILTLWNLGQWIYFIFWIITVRKILINNLFTLDKYYETEVLMEIFYYFNL